jgi:hypothetical protein
MGSPISVHGYGKVSIAPAANAPLLVVSGGIAMDTVTPTSTCWEHGKGTENRFHIFAAVTNEGNGAKACDSLMKNSEGSRTRPTQADPCISFRVAKRAS